MIGDGWDAAAPDAASHRTRKFLNDPRRLVDDALAGFAAAHPELVRYDAAQRIIVRRDAPVPGKVGLISAGGSGCEPLHGGFVGAGMLDVACPGEIFTSPVPGQILRAMGVADGGRGVVQIVTNYPGEVMNFRLVAMDSADTGLAVESVLVSDDVAIADSARRRALGATVLVEKLAGAAAQRGADLATVAEIGRRVNARARSVGVGLSSCTVPATARRIFDLPAGQIELGVGISGEPGARRTAMRSAHDLAEAMLAAVLEDLAPTADAPVLLLVNGLGGTPVNELYLLYGELDRALREAGLRPARSLVGNYVTALDQAGASITVLELDEELTDLWDAPVQTAALCWGWPRADGVGGPPPSATPAARPRAAVDDAAQVASAPSEVASERPPSAAGAAAGPIDAALIAHWISETVREVSVEAPRLSELDAALGDGDHGTNMRRGFEAVSDALAREAPDCPGAVLGVAGSTLLASIGGASGALWGFGFRRAGRTLGEDSRVDGAALARALHAMADAIVELGEAARGDKTMLDAFAPAATALTEALEAGRTLEDATLSAARAARRGADSTEDMMAQKGRASFMGERSLGHQDPSANTTAILFGCLHRAVVDHPLELGRLMD